jgi:AraC family transcriptional regulator
MSGCTLRCTSLGLVTPCVAGHGRLLEEVRLDDARVTLVEHPAGLVIDRHAHDVAKLAILLGGGASERIGEELVEHVPLAIVARDRLAAHDNQYHAHGARSLIVELHDVHALPGALLPAEAVRYGRRIAAAFAARDRQRTLRAAIAAAVSALRVAPPVHTPAWLERAREALFAQIASPPSLSELARAVGVHPVHLAQAFRRRWHTTPLGYVRAHRVFRAVELMARGAPLASIAAEVGFADQSHMTRAIHRARQAPPGRLRQLRAPRS